MVAKMSKLGLVLSGGGAKGAYHVGILKYLAEQHIQPQAISGASIGSLNGAIVASACDIELAAQRLEQVWQEIAQDSPLSFNKLNMSMALLRTILGMYGHRNILMLAKQANRHFREFLPSPLQTLLEDPAFLDNQSVQNLLNHYADISALRKGLPFWLSVCPSNGTTEDIIGFILATIGVSNTKKSEFLKIQDLTDIDVHKALLASAAIPLAYEAQKINGTNYCDGGLGGFWNAQGNTPITPLIDHEKCTHVIVTHLEDGSFWNRYDFKQATILEIRPQGIAKKGMADILVFKKEYILEWMEQGYVDAKAAIQPVLEALSVFQKSHISHKNMVSNIADMKQKLSWLD